MAHTNKKYLLKLTDRGTSRTETVNTTNLNQLSEIINNYLKNEVKVEILAKE